MKKLVVGALVAVTVGGMFAGCGAEKPTTGTVAPEVTNIDIAASVEGIIEKFPIRMPVDVSEQDLKDVFQINMDNINTFAMKQCGMTPGIDVVGIFEVKEGKVEDVKKDLQKILDTKKTAAYLPPEMEALENAKIIDNGNYVGIFLVQGEEEGTNPASEIETEFNAIFTK